MSLLNEERGIQAEVRDLLGKDDDLPDNFEIKAEIVAWGGGDHFPDEYSWARLVNLFRNHGVALVLDTIAELEAELEEMGLELPEYYREGRPNSKLDQALQIARRNEAQWAREREERR